MIVKRKLYSLENKDDKPIASKISNSLKGAAKNISSKVKQGYNFSRTHSVKETVTEVGKGVRKGSKAAWKYTKKNPDEAIVLTGSYAIPGTIAAKLLKAGKKKEAALVGSIAAFPIGESYIAAKKGIQAWKNKKKKKDDNKT